MMTDFELYCRWLRRLERRRFEPDDVFVVSVRRVKRALAALDSVAKLGIGKRKACQIFVNRLRRDGA